MTIRCARILTLLSTLALLTGCTLRQSDNPSPSQRRSDGRLTWTVTRLRGVVPDYQVGWLDNRTILFIGHRGSKEQGLYAWDRQGPARLVLANAYRFCHDGRNWTALVSTTTPGSDRRGNDRYRLNPPDLSSVRLGRMRNAQDSYPNMYTCDNEPFPQALRGRHWEALRPADGYLDYGAIGQRNQKVSLLRPDQRTRQPLGFQVSEPVSMVASYSDLTRLYFVYDANFTDAELEAWGRRGHLDIQTLQPDGRVGSLRIIAGPWSAVWGGDRKILRAVSGIAFSSSGGSLGADTTAGLYLIRPERSHSKLDTGVIPYVAVSPDGCGLVYHLVPKRMLPELRSVNLCLPSPRSP
jgi:hypothetical protein